MACHGEFDQWIPSPPCGPAKWTDRRPKKRRWQFTALDEGCQWWQFSASVNRLLVHNSYEEKWIIWIIWMQPLFYHRDSLETIHDMSQFRLIAARPPCARWDPLSRLRNDPAVPGGARRGAMGSRGSCVAQPEPEVEEAECQMCVHQHLGKLVGGFKHGFYFP